ncbi:MAG: ribonuclease E inhibitor RraB [Colwellia sp.]
MTRDLELFPDNIIGNTLWQMQQQGDDLTITQEIEFSVLFPTQEQALKFGQVLLENNQKLSFTPFQNNEELPWEITAYPQMPLTYENIQGYQELLATSSAPFQGEFDGFYLMNNVE